MSSSKVIFLVGLPGSGKSHYFLFHPEKFAGSRFIDDPSKGMYPEDFLDLWDAHTSLVIADPLLCRSAFRRSAERIFESFDRTWIFFSNDLEVCLSNLRYRNDGRNVSESFMHCLSRDYMIPECATVIPVHRCL